MLCPGALPHTWATKLKSLIATEYGLDFYQRAIQVPKVQ